MFGKFIFAVYVIHVVLDEEVVCLFMESYARIRFSLQGTGVLSVVFSVFYAFITSSLSWSLWYRSIYSAFRWVI